jgi:hypothetical protein
VWAGSSTRTAGLKEEFMLEEKLKEAIIGELQRQAANRPQSLKVQDGDDLKSSEELIVNGKIDLAALAMVIAGSVAGGP